MAAGRPRGDLLGAAHRRNNLEHRHYLYARERHFFGGHAADGQVYDLDRIMFLRNYLTQMQRVITKGEPISGYFLWSLMDNFQWIFGYGKRFGFYRVNFETQVRVPKLSAAFYRDVVARTRSACDRPL